MLLFLCILICSCIVKAHIKVVTTNDTYSLKEAEFGIPLDSSGLKGKLIPISYLDSLNRETGCWPINVSSKRSFAFFQRIKSLDSIEEYPNALSVTIDRNARWIALVSRGECSFEVKVRNMQRLGASAVIVGNNIHNGDLIRMHSEGDVGDITIPSVFIAQWAYRDLRFQASTELIQSAFDDKESVEIGLEITLSRDEETDIPVLDVVFITLLSIIAPVLVFAAIYYLWVLIRSRNTRLRSASQTTDASLLISLPIHVFYIGKCGERDPLTCAICLDDFEDEDELRLLPICRHEFHIKCVDPWLLTKSRQCPICKRLVFEQDLREDAPLLSPTT